MIRRYAPLAATAAALCCAASPARAMVYGSNTVHVYTCVTPRQHGVQVEFDQHFCARATAAMLRGIDTDGDNAMSGQELRAFLEQTTPAYMRKLSLTAAAGGKTYPLRLQVGGGGLQTNGLAFVVRQKGAPDTLRTRWIFDAAWPPAVFAAGGRVELELRITYAGDRVWSQIAAGRPALPVRLLSADVPAAETAPRPLDLPPAGFRPGPPLCVLAARLAVDLGERPAPAAPPGP